MIFLEKKVNAQWFIITAILFLLTFPVDVRGGGVQIIVEGMNDYPFERQLNGRFDCDFTTLICVGYTGDKVIVTLEDSEDYGDILSATALVYYPQLGRIYPIWGNVFSSEQENSFDLVIPSGAPGIVVFLTSGYLAPSLGENPYKYTINVSFPQ